MQIQTIVGPQGPSSAGSGIQNLRGGASGEVVVQELHGRYYETAARKAIFAGANTAGVTTSAGFATTCTGLILTNPTGSTVNLVLNKVSYAALVAQTAALIFGLQTGVNPAAQVTQTTPIVPAGNFVGQPQGQGLLASAATLSVAPTRLILLDSLLTGAITTLPQGGKMIDMEGSLVIPPGGFVATYTSAASVASSLAFGFQWEEVPVVI